MERHRCRLSPLSQRWGWLNGAAGSSGDRRSKKRQASSSGRSQRDDVPKCGTWCTLKADRLRRGTEKDRRRRVWMRVIRRGRHGTATNAANSKCPLAPCACLRPRFALRRALFCLLFRAMPRLATAAREALNSMIVRACFTGLG